MKREKVCVFCGSSFGKNKKFSEAAKELGKVIAKNNCDLVYGGGNIGLMGTVADSVLENGGKVYGVIPEFLERLEVSHKELSELIVTDSMHSRKNTMYELADYFIVLPGGLGTIEEMTEVLTWSQLSIHHKACALINIDGFFNNYLKFLDGCVKENFFRKEHFGLLIIEKEPKSALEKCRSFVHPKNLKKWVDEIKGQND